MVTLLVMVGLLACRRRGGAGGRWEITLLCALDTIIGIIQGPAVVAGIAGLSRGCKLPAAPRTLEPDQPNISGLVIGVIFVFVPPRGFPMRGRCCRLCPTK
jgi:hypothetical protein